MVAVAVAVTVAVAVAVKFSKIMNRNYNRNNGAKKLSNCNAHRNYDRNSQPQREYMEKAPFSACDVERYF